MSETVDEEGFSTHFNIEVCICVVKISEDGFVYDDHLLLLVDLKLKLWWAVTVKCGLKSKKAGRVV